jgi:hypothetical protein
LTDPIRHDWPQVIRELEAVGITKYKMALMMHRQYVQIQRWASGVEPKHYEGEMLLAIHAEQTLQTEPSEQHVAEKSA